MKQKVIKFLKMEVNQEELLSNMKFKNYKYESAFYRELKSIYGHVL